MLEFRNRRIHLIPRLGVGNKNVHLRMKPAWIVKAASRDSDHAGGMLIKFSTGQPRAALRAKTALVFPTSHARREMIAQLPFRQMKCGLRQQQSREERATGHPLAVAAMTLEHYDRFGG